MDNCGGPITEERADLTPINIEFGAKETMINIKYSPNNSYARIFHKEIKAEVYNMYSCS